MMFNFEQEKKKEDTCSQLIKLDKVLLIVFCFDLYLMCQ